MRRKKLVLAIIVCWSLVALGIVPLLNGCAVRHIPGGGTAPATTFEQVLAWNAAAAQANDGFASNVISLQQGGTIGIAQAREILVKQAAIAEADKRITARISAAANCASAQVGSTANAAQLNAAGITCAQLAAPGVATDISLITGTISDLTTTGLTGISDPAKRQALIELLGTISALVQQIAGALQTQGVIK
jgi:hypothetical protein